MSSQEEIYEGSTVLEEHSFVLDEHGTIVLMAPPGAIENLSLATRMLNRDALLSSSPADASSFAPSSSPTGEESAPSSSPVWVEGEEDFKAKSGKQHSPESFRAALPVRGSTRSGVQRTGRPPVPDGPALCRRILASYNTTTHGWCELIELRPNQKGYAQLSHAGFNKFATAGEVALMAKGEANNAARGDQVSHLCHHTRCILSEHIASEPANANNARKGCFAWTPCDPGCEKCHGTQVVWLCPHRPRCVVHHDRYRSQKELIDHGICRDNSEHTRKAQDERNRSQQVGLPTSLRP